MQPHTPYYGSKAENIRQKYHNDQRIVLTNLMDDDMINEIYKENQYSHLLTAAMNDASISQSDIYTAYAENLEIVLSQVESLIHELSGRTIITSDHGELLGNPDSRWTFRQYWHYPGAYASELRVVPRLIVEEPSRQSEGIDKQDINAQLEALGCK